jgi:hypothetical protein
MFVLVFPTALIFIMNRSSNVSFDVDAIMNLFTGTLMINAVALTFISSSVGNTKSLDDGEYLLLLFTRPVFRWQYIVSKWLAGTALICLVIGLQICVFAFLFHFIGKGSLGFSMVDLASLILNALGSSALIVMIFAFPARIGAIVFTVLIYLSFIAPIMLKSVPPSDLWFRSSSCDLINMVCSVFRSLIYSPIDVEAHLHSVKILWLPIVGFVSNIILYLWIAVVVMNRREFFYTN